MGNSTTAQGMSVIERHFINSRFQQALELCRDCKELALREEKPDPRKLGWLRLYEYKSLFQLNEYLEAYNLLITPEPKPVIIRTDEVAWMYSTAAEISARLGWIDEILKWGRKALDLHMELGDVVAACQCANTICNLLSLVDRPDLNTEFADHLIEIGQGARAYRAVLTGYARLLDNLDAKPDTKLRRRIKKERTSIRKLPGVRLESERKKLLDRVDSLSA